MGAIKLKYYEQWGALEASPLFVVSSLERKLTPKKPVGRTYQYGFQGMERDDNVSGSGNSYHTEFRGYDPRLGRWKSLDPLAAYFSHQSPYIGFDNNPVLLTDPRGDSTEKNIVLETIDDVAASVVDGYQQVSNWWDGLDFTMSFEGNVNAGLAYSIEAEAAGIKVGLGEGTRYKLAGGAFTTQYGPSREGFDDVNGTRFNWNGYYIGKDGEYQVEEFVSSGLGVGGKENITYNKNVASGQKSNLVRTQSINAGVLKVETSEGVKSYPRGGLTGVYENGSTTTSNGKENEFIGFDFGVDAMIFVGFDVAFKVGFTNNYVNDNTPF